jgi:hypothetical protein
VIYWLYLRHHARSVSQINTIAIALSDERLLKLQKLANDLNVSIEELVLIGIENLLAQPESLSPNTAQDILNKNAKISPEIVDKFYALASDWEKDVAGLSSTAQMSQHPAYQEIISMGTQIVPLLLSELKENPLYWLSALSAIRVKIPLNPNQGEG